MHEEHDLRQPNLEQPSAFRPVESVTSGGTLPPDQYVAQGDLFTNEEFFRRLDGLEYGDVGAKVRARIWLIAHSDGLRAKLAQLEVEIVNERDALRELLAQANVHIAALEETNRIAALALSEAQARIAELEGRP